MKFRKKPVVVEAFRFGYDDPPRWARTAQIKGRMTPFSQDGGRFRWCEIETPEGTLRAEVGDWIIRGVAGDLYPCKPEIFAQTYEAVDTEMGGTNDGRKNLK